MTITVYYKYLGKVDTNLSNSSQRLTPSIPSPTSQRTKLTVKTTNLRREKHPP